MTNPPDLSQAKLTETAESFPSTYWITMPNLSPGFTYIVVPGAGNLWVFYEYAQAAKSIYVWHQGGSTTPINPGENNVAVGGGDMIVYQLFNPGSDLIKLGYQLT